ncbi:diphosphomevalonate decarboxylase [Lactobacillus sp. S2-2]|uniref:diphosphomevalonate decarboxylase n=1 Tax=Lactobacillus sp. S2-2 TaxID=2692917 RepID=UPI001F02846E|nr:diphosphomevalonate decarboxylase [Lactobacillus sp. S2-2]MCF6515074.1 diphosphomevalonate decarboxylase [Lactobacillus sp. S2-2]
MDNNIIGKSKVRAFTNIALVKYWGKKNEGLILPQNGSISLTLDHFYSETEVIFDSSLKKDEIYFNNERVEDNKIVNFLNILRNKADNDNFCIVKTVNTVPTSAGLASSSSGFAALAAASSKAIGMNLSNMEISKLARRGSGSATRSIYGGLVEWIPGTNDKNSYAQPLSYDKKLDLNLITVILNRNEKKISSRYGMKSSVETSPYYDVWIKQANEDLKNMKMAIKKNDFTSLGRITETNAMRMHSLTLSADPSFTYFNEDTLKTINLVKDLREQGLECYFTIDAGPNVKILCQDKNTNKIMKKLLLHFKHSDLVINHPGPGIQFIY